MWAILAGVVGIAASLVTWWVANNPRIRARKLLDRIQKLEAEVADALGAHDMDRVAKCNRELIRLRQTHRLLTGL